MKFSEALKLMEQGRICKIDSGIKYRSKDFYLYYLHPIHDEWIIADDSLIFYENFNWELYEEPKPVKKFKKTFYRPIYMDSCGDICISQFAFKNKESLMKWVDDDKLIRIEEITEEIDENN